MWSIWPCMRNSKSPALGVTLLVLFSGAAAATEPLPRGVGAREYAQNDAYRPDDSYGDRRDDAAPDDAYRPEGEGPPDYSGGRGREGGLYDDDAAPPPGRTLRRSQ